MTKKTRPVLSANDWSRLNSLLERGLALDPAAQVAWLEGLGSEPVPLRDLLRDLLAEAAMGSPEQDAQLMTSVAKVAADALTTMRRERAGDHFGPWRLEKLLAEGGMGVVWIAQRADGVMQRTAALKLPRAEWVDQGLTERIARERTILARLQHPNIAVLYDAGVAADGRPFLALEYVDGMPIDAWCKGRDVRAVLRLFVQVVRAVAYAHAQLVIHRDLKPANVLVLADGRPKLLDFGISKLIEGEAPLADATALTRLGGSRLTLAYAAPEQLVPGAPITVAADVYALGVMLFELLTGERLYRNSASPALEAEVAGDDRRRPSKVASDRARARALKGDLDAIVLTALRRDAAERYPSASAFADDVERYLAGQPVRARPDRRTYRLRKFLVRNAFPVAAGAAIVVALGVGLGVAVWQERRAAALTEFVLSLIRQADPNASQQTRVADLAMLASIEARIDQGFKGSADQLLQLRLTVGEAYFNRGEMMAARRVFQRAVDEAAPHVAPDDLRLLTARVRASDPSLIVSEEASAQLDRAIELLRNDRSEEGTALLIDALLIRHLLQIEYGLPEQLPGDRRLDVAREANTVAERRFGKGSRQELRALLATENAVSNIEGKAASGAMLDEALAQARRRKDGASASVEYRAAAGRRAALRCEDTPSRAEPIAQLRTAIREVQSAHGPTSVLLEELQWSLGRCLRAAGEAGAFSAAAAAYAVAASREQPPSTNLMRRAYRTFDFALQERDFAVAEAYYRSVTGNAEAIPEPALRERIMRPARMSHVCLLAYQGDADGVEREAAPLVAFSDAVYAKVGRLTPRQGELWICLARAQRQQRRYAEALRTLETFIDRCRTTRLAPALALNCEGEALIERTLLELDLGRIAAAEATVEQRLTMSRDMESHPFFLLAYGRVLLATGKTSEALEPLRRNFETWKSLQPDSPHTAEALFWLGTAQLALGDRRGHTALVQARAKLAASPMESQRRLAAETASKPER